MLVIDAARAHTFTCISSPSRPHCCLAQILSEAQPSTKDGLLNVKKFFPHSFDRILLDPPCSALGLRPKLLVPSTQVEELRAMALYQRQFVHEAVSLLRPGGCLTYSTCTIHALENEGMVRHILDKYPEMQLLPIDAPLGVPGLPGHGLDEQECGCVRRFDPTDSNDTMGFFVAKFCKRASANSRLYS
jgi:methyltransferase NSUN6